MTKRLIWAAILLGITIVLYYLTRPTPDVSENAPPVPNPREVVSKSAGAALPQAPTGTQEPVQAAPQKASELPQVRQEPVAAEPSDPSMAAPGLSPAPNPVEEITGPEDELENVQFMVRGYRDVLGENPEGNNAEITKALMGDNARQVKMPLPVGSHLNGNGELSDRWGTPYFFHQLSATEMEIRSAGPDQQMWTKDDLLTR